MPWRQLGGGLVLGCGVWIMLDPMIVDYRDLVHVDDADPLVSIAAWLFIIIGSVAFVVGFLGCCGARQEQQTFLLFVRNLVQSFFQEHDIHLVIYLDQLLC